MKQHRMFWLHFTGDDIKNNKIRSQALSKYLLEFNKLVMKVAKHRGHVSDRTPLQSFQTFTGVPRMASFAQPVELINAYASENTLLSYSDEYKTPYHLTYLDIQEILACLENNDYTKIKGLIPDTRARIDIIKTLIRLGPTKAIGLMITFTGEQEDFNDSPFKIHFSPGLKDTMVAWLEEEHIPDMKSYSGVLKAIDTSVYPLDIKIEVDAGGLLRCFNFDGSYDDLVPMLSIGDVVQVIGFTKQVSPHLLRMEEIINLKIVKKVSVEDHEVPPLLNDPIDKYLEEDENDTLEEWGKLAEPAFRSWFEEDEDKSWEYLQKET